MAKQRLLLQSRPSRRAQPTPLNRLALHRQLLYDMAMSTFESTRQSWNQATRHHNSHKGDQAARLASGEELLFEEELELLGSVEGRRLVHLQCNAGQDSLCLARRGAHVLGVDLADEAIEFARKLSVESGIEARFERSEVLQWLEGTEERFEIAFCSYGVVGWLPDIDRWARGVLRVLEPGGRLVYVDFHPIVWSIASEPPFAPTEDDYFETEPFVEPVEDYVAISGASLGAIDGRPPLANPHVAYSWQYGLGQILSAIASAGLRIERVAEWPYSNGCRILTGLVPGPERRWSWPKGTARLPLMFGLAAQAS